MNWTNFYAFCFLFGLASTVVSFFLGGLDGGHGAGADGGFHGDVPGGADIHADFDVHADADMHGGDSGAGHGAHAHAHWPMVNFTTVSAFLAWFGGAGFLLTRYSSVWAWMGLGLASVSGVAGAATVFWFVAKVLLAHDQTLDPVDFQMVGVLGHLSAGIRPGGTGEIIFSQQGTRRHANARSDTGRPIETGAEVVVTRYEQGIAYVRPWDELAQL